MQQKRNIHAMCMYTNMMVSVNVLYQVCLYVSGLVFNYIQTCFWLTSLRSVQCIKVKVETTVMHAVHVLIILLSSNKACLRRSNENSQIAPTGF